ncbi:MAG: clan AA aspartic protease [bacterium]|nr:clan AA aspartic protease [bacterium]
MGEVKVKVELENFVDRVKAGEGDLAEEDVRSFKTEAMVDTGAVMCLLPRDVVEYLGVEPRSNVIVSLADERKEEMPICEGITWKIGDRSATIPCLMGPPRCEPLLGQIVLEVLDLLVDCPGRRLVPNPDSPIYPSLKLK